jgi:hypothetical protein
VDGSEQILRSRLHGKVARFLFVGAVSGLLLPVSFHFFQEDQYLPGILTLAGSWYPLFRLGRLHAWKERRPE